MLEILDELMASVNRRIKDEPGLAYFVSERLQFEGWLKVITTSELRKILTGPEAQIKLEYQLDSNERVDIVMPGLLALELKVVATNYAASCVDSKQKDITNQIRGVVSDLRKLSYLRRDDAVQASASFGIAFPLQPKNHQSWMHHVNNVLVSGNEYFPGLSLEYIAKTIKLPCINGSVSGLLFALYVA